MTTEVYSCKPGQPLREGRLEYAPHITDKTQAEADAKRRCQKDQGFHRIAYYEVHEDGRFRNFYTYTNPNARADQPKAPPAQATHPCPQAPACKPLAAPAPATRLEMTASRRSLHSPSGAVRSFRPATVTAPVSQRPRVSAWDPSRRQFWRAPMDRRKATLRPVTHEPRAAHCRRPKKNPDRSRSRLAGHGRALRAVTLPAPVKGEIDTPKASEASPMAAYLFMLNSMMDRFQVNCSHLAPDGIRP